MKKIETPGKPLDWRVEKMKLSKDKTQIVYNDFLTLDGIPKRRCLIIPAWESISVGVGDRPVSRQDRQA